MEKEKPIGIFDSGIGGLTVVKRISSILPMENLVYFGDTARVPYGSKSNETIIEYSVQDAKFLLNKNIKLLVVACNTASSAALPELRKLFSIPVIGMITPGAELALSETNNKRIGVIGTHATVNNKAYSKEIHKLNPSAEVFEKACPLFVPLVEEGWIDHKAAYLIAEEYLRELRELEIDTLVLGCTHYPILSNIIQHVMEDKVKLIDSGLAAASIVKKELERSNLQTNSYSMGNLDLYVSDIPQKFKTISEIFMGKPLEHIKKIDIELLHQFS